MDSSDTFYKVRELVARFDDAETFEDAVEQVEMAGIDRADISMIASQDAIVEKLGHIYRNVRDLEDDARVPQTVNFDRHELAEGKAAIIGFPVYIGGAGAGLAVVASGGTLAIAAVLAAAGAAAGAGIGAIFAHAIDKRHADTLEQHLAEGGLLVWVRLRDETREAEIEKLLKACGGRDVHGHSLKRYWGTDDVPLHDFNPDPLLEKGPNYG
ncbi:hypothetical protein [Roseibium aggregatum]|uniref:DUF1269 domain-containing protein n=1 Tax=Roseibium aggregatum TaxID=187304 RepID=A0A926S6U4_9HYPH|nr:hypothetical protein [Roseibium aggregatum]MBD1548918.1 hypothetical protein [Roseibium aggregatum]